MNQIAPNLPLQSLEISSIAQQILNFSTYPVVITDSDWHIVAYNRPYELFIENIVGTFPEIGLELPALFSKNPERKQADMLNQSIETIYQARKVFLAMGERFEHQNSFVINGEFIHYRTQYNALIDNQGEVIGFIESHQSMDAQNYQLQDLQKINEELKEGYLYQSHLLAKAETDRSFSDQMLWGIFQASPVGIGLLSLSGELKKANPSLVEILGLKSEEIQSITLSKLIHPQDLKRFTKPFEELINGKRESFQSEIRILRPNHEQVCGLANISILKDINDNAQHVICMLSDISSRKRLKENLRLKNRALQKANTYLDNFVHAIAHDLRAPIANLKQVAELLLMLNANGDPIYSKLEISVERLDRTVSGLINIIDAQRVSENSIAHISFEGNMARLMEDFSDQIAQQDASINTDFKVKEICYIAPYLESIMRNLFQNSLKYAHPKRKPQITISNQKKDGMVLFSIQDNGIGINLEEVGERLFRPFKRFTQQAEGNGIGLHLVKSMVEKNEGRIEVQSQPGHGTRFDVYLKPYQKNEKPQND